MGFFRGLIGGLGFLSVIPVGRDGASFKAFQARGHLLPLLGLAIGAPLGYVSIGFSYLPAFVAGALYIIAVYMLTGIHHIDGLMDFGDAVVAHGSREDKRKIMKDVVTGAGGVLFLALTLLALYSAAVTLFSKRLSPLQTVAAFALAEACAKQAMLTLIVFGKSSHEGMGAEFIARASVWNFLMGLGVTSASAIVLGAAGWTALLVSLGATALILRAATRSFGGVGGDVMGAANEMIRAIALLAVVIVWTLS